MIARWSKVVLNPTSQKLVDVLEFYPNKSVLYITSGADGDHGTGSYHYGADYQSTPCWAIDIGAGGVTPVGNVQMRDVAKWLYDNFADLIVELIHSTPFNDDEGFYVKNGVRYPGGGPYGNPGDQNSTAAAHLNHVHFATTLDRALKIIDRAATLGVTPVTIKFYDISEYNGVRSFSTVESPTVVARSSIGTVKDTCYEANKLNAAKNGNYFVAYHFLNHHSLASPTAQAEFAAQVAGKTPLMLDWEPNRGQCATVDDAKTFITTFRSKGGILHWAYLPHWTWANPAGINGLGQPDLTWFKAWGLHLVSSNYTTYSDTGPGWSGYGGIIPEQWQFTSTPLDRNAFKGTLDQYKQLTNPNGETDMQLTDKVSGTIAPDGTGPRSVEEVLRDGWLALLGGHGNWQAGAVDQATAAAKSSAAALDAAKAVLAAIAALPQTAAQVDVDALAAKVAAALIAANTNGLSTADHAAIVADVRSVFADAGQA